MSSTRLETLQPNVIACKVLLFHYVIISYFALDVVYYLYNSSHS